MNNDTENKSSINPKTTKVFSGKNIPVEALETGDKNIPRLRFPKFKDKQWKYKKLSQLGQTINGLNGKSAKDFGKGKPFITYKQVFDNSKVDLTKCSLVEIADDENQNSIHKGDILITTSSETPNEVGYASVVLTEPDEPTYLNSFCFSFRPFSLERLKPEFSQYLFHSPIYRKSIEILAQGITRFNITKGAFLNLKVPLPSSTIEQQKIADCLSTLDEVIEGEEQKLELYIQHKMGLLQNLFPHPSSPSTGSMVSGDSSPSEASETGDKNIPRLRFPEFKNSGEWVVKKLGEIAEIIGGGTPDTKNPSYWDGNINWFTPTEVKERYVLESKRKITEKGLKNSSAKLLPKGAILVTTRATIGDAAIAANECCTNQGFQSFIVNDENFNIFVYYWIIINKNIFIKKASGSTFIEVGKNEIKTIHIPLPSLPEQQKIADCLSSLDDLINAQKQKIELLKQHKKGLLQGLFPI
ncbi:MAG: restriction endonuclease subunit S [Candidatus Kapabacteria bacterium]|nr:restriction endonuclease subunit S [Candidatus Kapabacteria bacterium]